MPLLISLFSITIAQIPGVIMRYLPFSKELSQVRKKKLFIYYTIIFIFHHLAIYLLVSGSYDNVTPLTYKRMLFLLSTFYILINIAIIKGNIYKHIFVAGMQGGYALFIHSIVALFVGYYCSNLPLYIQLVAQTLGFISLFTLLFIPLLKTVKTSIIFNSSITNEYYWNIIWLIPALAIFSDAMVTMNTQWINSTPQILSRIMTALSLIVSWKWITLDFESLEDMLYLKSLNKSMDLQTQGIIEQANLLKESENHIKVYKHDMRHNLNILNALIQENNIKKASEYIASLDSSLKTNIPITYCNNTIINSTFLVYMSKANELNIPVKTELSLPENLPFSSKDIAILVANAFENAIHASSNQNQTHQEILISAKFDNDKLAIVIKNRFDGEVLLGHNGFPTTDKPGHGIGISSILSIVKKYNAFANCSHKDGWFNMTFLFTNNT